MKEIITHPAEEKDLPLSSKMKYQTGVILRRPADLLILWVALLFLALLLSIFLHEVGHGLGARIEGIHVLDSGVLLLDTAHGYMGGRNEEVIGGVIKGRPRESYIIGSKVNLSQNRTTGLYVEGATTEEFLKKLDLRLKRLGVDYVDILYQHGVSRKESVAFEPILKAFDKAKKDGKIRFAGVPTHTNEPEVIDAATDSKAYDVILTAYNFKQKHYSEVRKAIARASQAGIGIVGMKAMRGGYQQPPTVKHITASLKWILQDPNVHTVVPGLTTFEQMEIDLSVMEDLARRWWSTSLRVSR